MHHVRTEMLVLVLNEMEEFDWRKESKGKVDWWFGTVFGHLVRLAYFELGYIDKNYWQRLLRLFRHYFGSEIDAYFPAIFLAAATSGGSARDEGLIGEARRILDVLEAGDSPFLTHGTID